MNPFNKRILAHIHRATIGSALVGGASSSQLLRAYALWRASRNPLDWHTFYSALVRIKAEDGGLIENAWAIRKEIAL